MKLIRLTKRYEVYSDRIWSESSIGRAAIGQIAKLYPEVLTDIGDLVKSEYGDAQLLNGKFAGCWIYLASGPIVELSPLEQLAMQAEWNLD